MLSSLKQFIVEKSVKGFCLFHVMLFVKKKKKGLIQAFQSTKHYVK